MDFTNKVAVITGGASGIGLAVARALGAKGAKLVLADIEKGALDKSASALNAEGIETIGVVTNVADKASVDALANATWAKFGGCNIVMHNAGIAVFGPTQDMAHNDWRWTIDVNLW